MRNMIQGAKRVVIKIGTSTLTHSTGKLNFLQIERLVRELSDLANQGKEIILVTSGAVSVGMGRLGFSENPKTIPDKQAAAAVGQGILMHIYEKLFGEYGQIVAQVLLTREDAYDRKRYTNSRNTLFTLLVTGVIPIINENDAVAIEELKYGDNDTLSAMVASIVEADALVILSDVGGVYTDNPQTCPQATLISEIKEITPYIEELAKGPRTSFGTGGMHTKIQAAKIAAGSGIMLVIASGAVENVVSKILSGGNIGTAFIPQEGKLQARKRWLAFGAKISGEIVIDKGCAAALLNEGSSLLAAGISAVRGVFEQGSTIKIITANNREIARGLANYNSIDTAKIMGVHTSEISNLLGYKSYDEVIHRNNLVLIAGG